MIGLWLSLPIALGGSVSTDGGTAFGLPSMLDAQILPGFSTIAELIHLEQEIKNSDSIITPKVN
jgi:glycerate kinase